jgi:hypothetical protein
VCTAALAGEFFLVAAFFDAALDLPADLACGARGAKCGWGARRPRVARHEPDAAAAA